MINTCVCSTCDIDARTYAPYFADIVIPAIRSVGYAASGFDFVGSRIDDSVDLLHVQYIIIPYNIIQR